MKIYRLCLLAIVVLPFKILAQDQLFKKDNTKLLVKIIEINPEVIKFKYFDNPTGPIYSESKSNIALIIYESGLSEAINAAPTATVYARENEPSVLEVMNSSETLSKKDSLIYYKYSNNISMNFLNFFNNEIGLTYQKDYFSKQFNIIIPVSFGVQKPSITQSVYFGNTNRYNNNYFSGYEVTQKIFDIGFGINYYPTLRTNLNYFIGPMVKYMQYNGTQTYSYRPAGSSGSNVSISKNNTLTRYAVCITNGVVLRTRSRITLTALASLGFKDDSVDGNITDPVTNTKVVAVTQAASLYFWGGLNVGFNF